MTYAWIIGTWFPSFANLCLQSTIVLTLTLAALFVLRRRSPALRHQIAAAALGSLLVLPLLSQAPAPKLGNESLLSARAPSSSLRAITGAANGQRRTGEATQSDQHLSRVDDPTHASLSTERTARHIGVAAITQPRARTPVAVTIARQANRAAEYATTPQVAVGALGLWATGVTLLFVRFAISGLRLSALTRRCHSATDPALALASENAARRMGFRVRPRLLLETPPVTVSVPVTWGIVRPVILIPVTVAGWSRDQMETVLLHELAHIRRGDWLAQTLAQLACALFWFQPLAWILSRRMQDEAERACDDAVLALGVTPSRYAAVLVDVVRAAHHDRVTLAALSMARGSRLTDRIQSILRSGRISKPASRRALIFATGIALAIVLPVAWLRPLSAQRRVARSDSAAAADLQQALVCSGLVPVIGPGVEITLRDSNASSVAGSTPASALIHETDISRLIAELYGAGAEAVAVGDQRISDRTAVSIRGADITVNGIALHPPYVIRAIGNPGALDVAMGGEDGVLANLRRTDPGMALVKRSASFGVPAIVGRPGRIWSRPVPIPTENTEPAAAAMLRLRWLAGQTQVAGPGVAITLSGTTTSPGAPHDPNGATIHDQDLVALVNQLRSAGAEAIAIGNRRIVASSALRVSISRTNANREQAPVLIQAIGDPDELTEALARTNGGLDVIRRGNSVTVRVERVASLQLPGHTAPAMLWAHTTVTPGLRVARNGGPSGRTITLADGTGVELIAVGSAPVGYGGEWWRPDGTLLTDPPVRTNTRFHNSAGGVGTQYLARKLFFRIHSANEGFASTTGYVVDPTHHLDTDGLQHGRDDRLNDTLLVPETPATGSVALGFPKTEARCTYRFGIATGPWETIAVTRPALILDGSPGPSSKSDLTGTIRLTDKPTFYYRDRTGTDHLLPLLGTREPLGDVARRVVAMDRDGRELPIEKMGGDYRGEASFIVRPSTMARIFELRLETRPYQWAEFRDIELQPKRPAGYRPIAAPQPLPAFRHTFGNGVTIGVAGLMSQVGSGGHWWRPDGTPAAGPWSEFINSVPFGDSQSSRSWRAILFTQTGTKDAEFSEARQLIPGVADWPRVTHEGNSLASSKSDTYHNWMLVEYPPDVREFTLRTGVAYGAWQTAGVIAMPHDVMQRDALPHSYQGDIRIRETDHATLSYTSSNGQEHTIAFLRSGKSMGDVARRFIAIDSAGRSIVLQATLGDQFGRMIGLSFADTSKLRNGNDFDLASIKEFRLQTRPYEWAEFKGIRLDPGR